VEEGEGVVLVHGYERVWTGMTSVTIVSLVIVDTWSDMVVKKVVKVLIWVVPHKVTGGRISHISSMIDRGI